MRDNRNFFAVLNTYHPNTFASFWNDRAFAGQDVSQTALSALYQGTIDYGFRNPLSDYVAKHFPAGRARRTTTATRRPPGSGRSSRRSPTQAATRT